MSLALVQTAPDAGAVLTKATLRAADLLGLSHAALARTVGVSEATVSRLARGTARLEPLSKPGELALLLVRAYRALDALVGNDDTLRRAWMSAPHRVLGTTPREAIANAEGLVRVVTYLDGARALA